MIMLPDASSLGLFVVAALVLLLTPGPAVLYIVTRSIEGGRAAGLVSMLGVHVGTLVHVAAAAVGLSAVLVASATAFTVVKWLGAAYLVYLGVRRIIDRTAPRRRATRRPRQLAARVSSTGSVVNVAEPPRRRCSSSRSLPPVRRSSRAASPARRSSARPALRGARAPSPTAPTR
jgi:threonine/homoserine/homoserine lactone efflux protein